MKNLLQEKPWYFATTALGFFVQPIFDWFVMYFFNEAAVKKILETPVPVSKIIPFAAAAIIFFVCTIVFVVQQSRKNEKTVSPDEIGVLNETLLSIVDENEHIESMQAFQYRVKNADGYKYIKLSYLAGAANERIEINTILQTYFYFSYPVHKKIRNISSRYNKYLNETDATLQGGYWNDFASIGIDFCNQLMASLNSIKSTSEIEERHCDMYRVLAKLLPTVSKRAFETFLENSSVEEALIKRKKTGILGALVINDLYIFKNQTSLAKSNRIYFAFPYSTEKSIVLLGSIDGKYFEEMSSVEVYCKSIVSKVCGSHKI